MADDQEQEPYVEPTYLTRKEVEETISCGRYAQSIYPDNCVVLEKLALKPWRPYARVEWDDYDYTESGLHRSVNARGQSHHDQTTQSHL